MELQVRNIANFRVTNKSRSQEVLTTVFSASYELLATYAIIKLSACIYRIVFMKFQSNATNFM